MLAVAFVMVVLGCGDDDAACAPVRTLPAAYASLAACNAAVNIELPRQNDVDYPVIAARCQAMSPLPPIQVALAVR